MKYLVNAPQYYNLSTQYQLPMSAETNTDSTQIYAKSVSSYSNEFSLDEMNEKFVLFIWKFVPDQLYLTQKH